MNAATEVFEHSRPDFREKVFALVGHSTYRTPAQGSSEQRQIPSDHMVASALSFGRRKTRDRAGRLVPDRNDIGPEIAFDMATGCAANYLRVCEWLGRAVSAQRWAVVNRNRAHVGAVAVAAYNAVVRGQPAWLLRPEAVTERDWGEMVIFAGLLLEHSAADAYNCAARYGRGRPG